MVRNHKEKLKTCTHSLSEIKYALNWKDFYNNVLHAHGCVHAHTESFSAAAA